MSRASAGALLVLVAACSGDIQIGGGQDGAGDPSDNSDNTDETDDNTDTGPQVDGGNPNPTPPADPGAWGEAVNIRLTSIGGDAETVNFGVPVPPGVVIPDAAAVRISVVGGDVIADAKVRETLAYYDATHTRTGAKALQVQFPASVMTGETLDVEVRWTGGASATTGFVSFSDPGVSMPSSSTVTVADRTIEQVNGEYQFVENNRRTITLFTSREPRVFATYPDGYLAQTRILGHTLPASKAVNMPGLKGLAFLSEQFSLFASSAMFDEPYALNPDPASVPDPNTNFEGWLYDRCVTFLMAYISTNEGKFQREAFRQCTRYADQIDAEGFFTGKPDPDDKYSHLRGLYAYFAMTGDEGAYEAGKRVADMWFGDRFTTAPYAAGHLLGPERLFTERQIATAMEGLFYGAWLTGETKYLDVFIEMKDTAHKHVTGGPEELAEINPGVPAFPPQNCFIHNAYQHSEGDSIAEPWCSPWMSELMVDVLLAWQAQSDDPKVDDIFVRLTRALRDMATGYMIDEPYVDSFLEPERCATDNPDAELFRVLVPFYGVGIGPDGVRYPWSEYEDYEHCADASALAAAGIRGLYRQGLMDRPGVGPFATEGESFSALHQELLMCAKKNWLQLKRVNRDPRSWSSNDLADHVNDAASFIAQMKIGFPTYHITPQRKFSWWFNMTMLQLGMLQDAKVNLDTLKWGFVEPEGCD